MAKYETMCIPFNMLFYQTFLDPFILRRGTSGFHCG